MISLERKEAKMKTTRGIMLAVIGSLIIASSVPSQALAGPGDSYPYWEWGARLRQI